MNGENSIVTGVAGRYATALFELARDAKSIDKVGQDLDSIAGMIAASADLKRLVESPAFTAEQQSRALAAVLKKAGIGDLASNFVLLVARNRRLFALPDMIVAYRRLVANAKGQAVAEVTSAHALTAAQQKSLAAALKSSLGKDVTLDASVDASLLGGLVVKVGSRMIDTSIRTKLNSLRLAMKEVG